jgi:hypothetical protein
MPAGLLHDLLLRLRTLAHRRRLDADADDELAFHLEMRASQICLLSTFCVAILYCRRHR